ncbi:MAG TPA: 6,7-dimethyl-8-ribityllumazine synthase [Candidatus Dormibacteraeota bacterium]
MGERGQSGSHDASGLRVGVAVSRYNQDISERLLTGALEALHGMGVNDSKLTVCWVPGALELPLAAAKLVRSHDAVICLGCVIKGETAHFEHVATQCAAGVQRVALDSGTPVAFGVLTTYDRAQALSRSTAADNKGAEAAETAVEMANLLKALP